MCLVNAERGYGINLGFRVLNELDLFWLTWKDNCEKLGYPIKDIDGFSFASN